MSEKNSSLSLTQEVRYADELRQGRDMSDKQIARLWPPFAGPPTAEMIAEKREAEERNRFTHTQRALVHAVEEACWRAYEQGDFTYLDNATITLNVSDLNVSVTLTQNSQTEKQ